MTGIFTEAFKELQLLQEENFKVNDDGLSVLDKFLDGDNLEDTVVVIDPKAEDEEELEDSYVGKVIFECPVCKTFSYHDVGDVEVDEESEMANISEDCPYCHSVGGFNIVGEVAPFKKVEIKSDEKEEVKDGKEEVEETNETEVVEESLKEDRRQKRFGLPKEVTFKADELYFDKDDDIDEILGDALSDTYGFLHYGFNYDIKRDDNGNPVEFRCYDIDWDTSESLKEDTVKQGNYWVNKGKEGTHGKFKTKKAADAQRRAMFAQGYTEKLEESITERKITVEPGYYEWILKVDDTPYYSFGDLGDVVDDFDSADSFAKELYYDFLQAEEGMKHGEDVVEFVTTEIEPIRKEEKDALYNELKKAFLYYKDSSEKLKEEKSVAPRTRDDIDAIADDKKEKAKAVLARLKDDADSDKDYQLKRNKLKEPTKEDCHGKKLKEQDEDIHVYIEDPEPSLGIDFDIYEQGMVEDGIVIAGNRDFNEKGDPDLIEIIEDSDKDFVLQELEAKTGKQYTKKTIRGSVQSDWNTMYYPVGTGEEFLNDLEDYYFGSYSAFYPSDSDAIDDPYITIPDHLGIYEKEGIKKYIAKELGVPEDKVKIRKFTGYSRVANYDESCHKNSGKKKLKEAPIYGLTTQFDSSKSFGGKAQVDVQGDKQTLYSYNTPVAKIEAGKVTLLPKWDLSATTLRHIKEFLKQNGFKAETRNQIAADYAQEMEEACGKSIKKTFKKVKEDKTSKTDRIDAKRDNRVEKARKALKKTIDDADAQRDDEKKTLVKEDLSYDELVTIDSEWEKFKKKKGKSDADAAWEFIETECKDVYDTDEEKEELFGYISTLEEPVEESCKGEKVEEALEKVELETGNEKITISSEEKEVVEESTEGTITPVSQETVDEIVADENAEGSDEISFDEFEEEEIADLGESFLKEVYGNVKDFKAEKVSKEDNKIKVEGLINFNSGASKKTAFTFTPSKTTKTGKVKLLGENLDITSNRNAFTLSGRITDKKLIAESLTYNYGVKTDDNKTQRIYGRVQKKSK